MADLSQKSSFDSATQIALAANCFSTPFLTALFAVIASELRNTECLIAEVFTSRISLELGFEQRNPPCAYRGVQRNEYLFAAASCDARDLAHEHGLWTLRGADHFAGLNEECLDIVLTVLDTCADVVITATNATRVTLEFLRTVGIEVVTVSGFLQQLARQQPAIYQLCCNTHRENMDVSAEIWNAWRNALE